MTKSLENTSVPVWDLPTRLFHWSLALLVLMAWMTSEYFEELGDPRLRWHRWTGYGILTLILWRGLWGLWGPPSAQFKNFIRGPKVVCRYLIDEFRGRPRQFLGHNPLGSVMILSLLLCVGTISIFGLFSVEENDLAAGPLAYMIDEEAKKMATKNHRFLFDSILLGLITLHIAANVALTFLKNKPLLKAMITGHKPQQNYEDQFLLTGRKDFKTRAIFFLSVSFSTVLLLVLGLGK